MAEEDLIVFANGEYLPRSKARIDPFDFGWRRGWVVYDSAPVLDGYVFKLDKHIDRLWNSMLAAKITPPFTQEEAKDYLIGTVKKNGLRDATTWIYVSYGVLATGGFFWSTHKANLSGYRCSLSLVWWHRSSRKRHQSLHTICQRYPSTMHPSTAKTYRPSAI